MNYSNIHLKMVLAYMALLLFIILFLFIIHWVYCIFLDIKDEINEVDEKLDFIKYEMKEEKKKELENILNHLPKKEKKEFVDNLFKQKYKKSMERYEKEQLDENK